MLKWYETEKKRRQQTALLTAWQASQKATKAMLEIPLDEIPEILRDDILAEVERAAELRDKLIGLYNQNNH